MRFTRLGVASRIGEYARPSALLVSRAVVEVSAGTDRVFSPIGGVTLKGLSGTIDLFSARSIAD